MFNVKISDEIRHTLVYEFNFLLGALEFNSDMES